MPGIILMLIILFALIVIYVYFVLRRLIAFYGRRSDKDSEKQGGCSTKRKGGSAADKARKLLLGILSVIVALCSINMRNMTSIFWLHILAAFLCLDIVAFVVRKRFQNQSDRKSSAGYQICRKIYRCGLLPLAITGVITAYGYYNLNHIRETIYTVETEKAVREEGYRIVLLTDVHYGTIQDRQVLKDTIERLNDAEPDIVILGGDIVEEGTSREEMEEVFSLLGGLQNTEGIYYVYGNHDRQPYTRTPTFSAEELELCIWNSGIQILEDSYVEIGDDLILAGRGDAGWGNTADRASVKTILEGADKNRFIIMADHQPIEAEENSAQGVELELSGHTHGGQIWPAGIANELSGTLNYGRYERDDCTVIVSSGFAGWRYPIRTGKHSEYVIVDIQSSS